jgi:hypothetical protein
MAETRADSLANVLEIHEDRICAFDLPFVKVQEGEGRGEEALLLEDLSLRLLSGSPRSSLAGTEKNWVLLEFRLERWNQPCISACWGATVCGAPVAAHRIFIYPRAQSGKVETRNFRILKGEADFPSVMAHNLPG